MYIVQSARDEKPEQTMLLFVRNPYFAAIKAGEKRYELALAHAIAICASATSLASTVVSASPSPASSASRPPRTPRVHRVRPLLRLGRRDPRLLSERLVDGDVPLRSASGVS